MRTRRLTRLPTTSAVLLAFAFLASHAAGAMNYYFSQLAFAGGWQTTLTYINYSPQTVTCTTSFYSDSGSALPLPFSEGTLSTRTDILLPGSSIHDQTIASLTAPVTEGGRNPHAPGRLRPACCIVTTQMEWPRRRPR